MLVVVTTAAVSPAVVVMLMVRGGAMSAVVRVDMLRRSRVPAATATVVVAVRVNAHDVTRTVVVATVAVAVMAIAVVVRRRHVPGGVVASTGAVAVVVEVMMPVRVIFAHVPKRWLEPLLSLACADVEGVALATGLGTQATVGIEYGAAGHHARRRMRVHAHLAIADGTEVRHLPVGADIAAVAVLVHDEVQVQRAGVSPAGGHGVPVAIRFLIGD